MKSTNPSLSLYFAKIAAIEKYRIFNDDSDLIKLGLNRNIFKRKRGAPPKSFEQGGYRILFQSHIIVQLVYKQKWQAGKSFSNKYGARLNECFYRVADYHDISVDMVIDKWKAVPLKRRKQIEWMVVESCLEAGLIHPKKIKKALKLPRPKSS